MTQRVPVTQRVGPARSAGLEPEQHPRRDRLPGGSESGFTLLELIVVVAILGLVARVVYINAEAVIPESVMDAERSKLAATLDQLRSEAVINSKSYKLELDLTNDRWRYILPPEMRVTSDQFIDKSLDAGALEWSSFDPQVDLRGVQVVGGPILRSGLASVVFDHNGFSADQVFYFQHRGLEDLVWTLIYRGLTGTTEWYESFDGVEHRAEELTEGAF